MSFTSTKHTRSHVESSPKRNKVACESFKTPKKHKSTYVVRKEQSVALRAEIRRLESHVEVVTTRSLPFNEVKHAASLLQRAVEQHEILMSTTRNQQLELAKAQSLVSRNLDDHRLHPLYTYIRLPKDWGERRATLMGIREEKLRSAYDYVQDSCQVDYATCHRYETENGDFCCTIDETIKFVGIESLQQVFDVLVSYVGDIGTNIFKPTDDLNAARSGEVVHGGATNSRALSRTSSGIPVEENVVSFSQISIEDARSDSYAVMALEAVDKDELFPFNPSKFARRDITGAIVLTENTRKIAQKQNCAAADYRVTMHRRIFLTLHQPGFLVSSFDLDELEDISGHWGNPMLKAMRTALHLRR